VTQAGSHVIAAPPRSALLAHLVTETAVARAALGVIALHVADDSFFQPEPGTSAADHLVSGLVPLALIAGAAVLYGRVRAGFRASLALLFGVIGVLGGVEAVHYGRNGGLSGDDFTGLLCIPAGLTLLGLGAVTLWRSRRTDDALPWRYVRRLLLVVGTAVVAGLVLFPIGLAYVVTHTARAEVPPPDLGAPYENVEFTTSDGLRLKGWYIASKNGAAVIAVPGRSGPRKQARMLAEHGYGVLLFDRRGEGESDGDPNVFGWQGERDLHAAAAYLQGRPDVDPERIGGIGLSVGGEMLIEAAAESDVFQAIVSEGGSGRSVRDDLANTESVTDELATLIPGALSLSLSVFTNTLPPADLKGLVPQIAPRSVLFIYALDGQGGTEKGPNQGFYAEAGEPKAIWEVPEGGHVGGIDARPAEYEKRVIAFFDQALLEGT
jgi:uncharacterized protein